MTPEDIRVVALLDYPNPESFGMGGFVAEHGGSELRIHGIRGRQNAAIRREEVDQLIAEGHALGVDKTVPPWEGVQVACWLGVKFEAAAERDGAPRATPPADADVTEVEGKGRFWVAPAAKAYARLEQWLKGAARLAIQQNSAELADLMVWVLPVHELTHAALWYTRPTEEAKQEELEWWARVEWGPGGCTPIEQLRERYEALVDSFRGSVQRKIGRPAGRAPGPGWIVTRTPPRRPFFSSEEAA